MDPLTVFKDFVQSNQLAEVEVDAAEGKVRFADKYSFPASAATAFRRSDTSQYYPLGVVVNYFKLFHQARDAGQQAVAEYIRKFPKREDQVALQDRNALISYLKGEVATVSQLDENVPLVPFEPPAKRQKVGGPEPGEADALQHLFGHEKQLRDRNSLLCAPGADFRPMLAMVDRVMAARKEMERAAKGAAAKSAPGQQRPQGQPGGQPQQAKQQQPAFVKSSGRGDRAVDTSGTLKALGADSKVADSLGLGYGLAAGAAAAAVGSKVRPSAAPQQGHRAGSSSGKGAAAAAAAAAATRPSSGSRQGGAGGKLRPIILVPAGYSAMVNLYNAKQLLEQHQFVPSGEVQDQLAAAKQGKPQAPLEFVRRARRGGSHLPRYSITDKVPKAGHPDWKRVVAVIVMGKPWQFKEFPYKGADKGNMVETFSNIFGAFFHYKDEKVPDAVQGWNVAKLPLRRDVRHLDDQVVLEFYDKLDAFLLSTRRHDLDY